MASGFGTGGATVAFMAAAGRCRSQVWAEVSGAYEGDNGVRFLMYDNNGWVVLGCMPAVPRPMDSCSRLHIQES